MNKKGIIGIVILALIGFGIWYYLGQSKDVEEEKKVVKIGVIIPLSGESAYWGGNIRDGVELAKNKINEEGGIKGRKIVIVYEDTKGEPKTATSAVNKLIFADKVDYFIGDVISSNILAIAPIIDKNKIPLICFGESTEITKASDYIFRNWNSASSDAIITGEFASQQSKKIILLSRNDAFGKSAKDLFEKEIQNNVDIVDNIQFNYESSDFKSLIYSFRDKEYDGIYFAGFHKEAMEFLSQYIELGGKVVNIYGVSSWEEKSLKTFIKDNYKGNVYYGYPKPPDSSLIEVQEFKALFYDKFGKEPEILNDNGYDAVMMYKRAIDYEHSFDRGKVKAGLYKLNNFKGATGKFSIDENGDVNKPFGLKQINSKGSEWVQ